jgi:hypothetical protein
MSTKTTFKRIALVAVAALTLGSFSAVSASATAGTSLPFGVTAASYAPADSYAATVAVSQIAGANNFVEFTAGSDSAAAVIVKVAGGTVASLTQAAGTSPAVATLNTASTEITYSNANLDDTTDAAFKVSTPTAGTITVTVVTRAFSNGVATDTALQTFTITVTSAAVSNVYSAANSTVYASTDATDAGGTTPDATTDAAALAAASTRSATAAVTAEVLKIVVDQEDANDVNLSTAVANTVSITGVGAVGIAAGTPLGQYAAESAQGSDFYVFADGRSGTGTVTVSVNGVVAKTYSVTFFGALASYSVVASKTNIGVGETGTLTVTGKDSLGNAATLGTVNATSATTTVATVTATDTSGVVTVTGVAPGTSVITLANATSSATVTTTLTVTVSKITAKSVALSFDKTEYAAGEKMTVTVTALDSNGAGVADGSRNLFSSAGITSNVALQGATWTASAAVTVVAGKATFTAYAPLVPGPISIMATQGTSLDNVIALSTSAAVVTASATVLSDGVAQAAADAAAEATDAANAATDAANAAAEAADAATAAAQDAADAVAALSVSVSAMIDALKKQITALTNLVIKIQKKVKA